MTVSKLKNSCRNNGLDWTPLRKVETEKNCYVEFYVRHPQTGLMVRKRTKFNQFVPGQNRDNMVAQYIRNTEAKLLNGWNPLSDDSHELRSGTTLSAVRKEYEEFLVLDGKRPKTIVDYCNRLKHFCEWASHHKVKYIGDCTSLKVEEYLTFKLMKKKVSACARNNERTFLSAFFSWCISHYYLENNPCREIKQMRKQPKHRRIITEDELRSIAQYFIEKDKYMLLAVMMQYYTLIRPNELLHLRVRDVNIKEQYVVVPAEYSKNHKEQPVSLNDRLVALMVELGIDRLPPDIYLFGYGCRPNYKPANHDLFRYRWRCMREELNIGDDVVFYSLKDTGIVDLINAEGVLLARDQARHSSISVTNLYAQYGSNTAHEQTKHFNGKL